jgi:hypothetical protein
MTFHRLVLGEHCGASVDDDVVILFTRNPDVPPYGLIPEATS